MKKKNNAAVTPAPPAPLNRRTFAFLLDWYLGSAFSAVPVGILWNMQTGEEVINTDITLFEAPYGWLAGALGLLFGIIYYYAVPLKVWQGQTLGKRLMALRITGEDGQPLSAGSLALRQIVGVMILEGSFMLTGQYVLQMLTMLTRGTIGKGPGYLLLAVFLISAWMVCKGGKAAHDIWAGSKVVSSHQ